MKRRIFLVMFVLALGQVFLSGCDELLDKDDEKDTLYVKFINDESSIYTITNIQIRKRGKVDVTNGIIGVWSSNLLVGGKVLAPGEHAFFTLDIPSGEWAEYQLGVNNGSGVEVMLYDQQNYSGLSDLPITHWAGDDRTVSVSIGFDQSTQTITVKGWSDWVGIDR